MDTIPWGSLVPVLFGGGGLIAVILTGMQKRSADRTAVVIAREKAQLEQEREEHKTQREALALESTTQGAVNIERERQETAREGASDQTDLTRGATALDRIRELEARNDLLIRDVGRRDAAVAHWKDACLEVSRYSRSLEDGFNLERSARVDELLLGVDPPGWTSEVVDWAPAPAPAPATPIMRPMPPPTIEVPVIVPVTAPASPEPPPASQNPNVEVGHPRPTH